MGLDFNYKRNDKQPNAAAPNAHDKRIISMKIHIITAAGERHSSYRLVHFDCYVYGLGQRPNEDCSCSGTLMKI